VNAIAYLDIGAGNGGIALNLSEDGMAFQAVGPLDSQTSISLRIQLPDSRTRIKTAAQIVWVSESNREAGVCFVDLPSEGRIQIQQWICSQIMPNAPSEGVPALREVVSDPPGKQETFREPRKDKWLTIAKLREQESADQTRQPIAKSPEKRFHKPVEREAATMFPVSGSSLGDLGERAIPPNRGLRPWEVPPQGAPYQSSTELPESGLDGQTNGQNSSATAVTVPSHPRADEKRDPDRLKPEIRTAPPTMGSPSTPLLTSAKPSVSDLASTANWAPVAASTIPSFTEATKRNSARKWAGVAVFFALIPILCFLIGTWVGSRGIRVHSVQTLTQPAVAVPITKPGTSGSNGRKASELTSAIANKARPEHVIRNSAPQNEKLNLGPVKTSPLVPPVPLDHQPLPAEQSLTSLTTPTRPESGSAPAPLSDNSAMMVPTPRIVAGRNLRPTDRFNECYLTYRVEPAYPLEARQQRVEGPVKIHLVVGANGKVRNMQVLSGAPLLAPAAMDAAKLWQYLPALLNGQPVETEQDIEIDFQLPH
jgi:TonB family protein